MDIEIWDGGLQEQEIEAVNKIKAAFADSLPAGKFQGEETPYGTSFKTSSDAPKTNRGKDMQGSGSSIPRARRVSLI